MPEAADQINSSASCEERAQVVEPPCHLDGHGSARNRADHLATTFEGFFGIPFTGGNEITILRNGVEIFPAMLEAISRAKRQIQLVTFVYWKGRIAREFAHALAARAREGVRVHLLLDAVGALPMDALLIDLMESAGVEVARFRPPVRWEIWKADNRTHRKVLVCDGQIAFSGGVGIAEEWEGDARHPGERRDTHFRVRGPAVRGLQAAFLTNWMEAVGAKGLDEPCLSDLPAAGDVRMQVLRSAASVGWSEVTGLLRLCLKSAEETLDIATAYFVPDEVTRAMFVQAVERGVRVRVLMPGEHIDHRMAQLAGENSYRELVDAGVELYAFEPSMMHCKIIIVDRSLVGVGSPNFDHRSTNKDDEIALNIVDDGVVSTLHQHYEQDLTQSHLLTPESWARRSLMKRVLERLSLLVRHEM